ncbi:MAG: DUF1778 domain-containing protein [Acidobacteriota bacterium]|nr:DUF1778 domain-containing protein [Acidobacteriota bacterium]
MATQALQRERLTEKLDLRISTTAKRKLVQAAAAVNCSMSEFVMASALARADEALADRTVFRLEDKIWRAFIAALDKPAKASSKMQALIDRPSVFAPVRGGKKK